ncbi:MAG TPA: hypothetical protein VHA52_05510 [Candidatus Babeliaceae bacterium]|nr:hypothetical protein [Candidatus Babeliaceae bacterium]
MIYLKSLPNYRISRTVEIKIQNLVLKHLKLDNLNNLRDKFEGMSFYNKIKAQIYSIIAIENFLSIKLLEWDDIEEKVTTLQHIEFNNNKAVIISSRINEPFFIPKQIKADYLFFTFFSENEYIYLAGYLPFDKIYSDNLLLDRNISPIKLRMYDGCINDISKLSDMKKFKI